MKVTIDTKEDSHEDIRKVLHILTNILEKKDFKDSKPEEAADTTSMMSMFDTPAKESSAQTAGTPPDFSSFLNLQNSARKNEDKDEMPRIEYF